MALLEENGVLNADKSLREQIAELEADPALPHQIGVGSDEYHVQLEQLRNVVIDYYNIEKYCDVVKLSTLTNEQCENVISDYGVIISDEFTDIDYKVIFADIEADLDAPLPEKWSYLGNTGTNISNFVKRYYGECRYELYNVPSKIAEEYPELFPTYNSTILSKMNYDKLAEYLCERIEGLRKLENGNFVYGRRVKKELVRENIKGLEENPAHPIYGYSGLVMLDVLYNEIRCVVIDYYDIETYLDVVKLSALTSEQCKEVIQYRMTIPEEFEDTDFKAMFADIEADIDAPLSEKWAYLGEFGEAVHRFTTGYYRYKEYT